MYKYRKPIKAADDADTRFDDWMKSIKDDFDYLVDTFDKLDRDGKREDAIAGMERISGFINDMISESADFDSTER